MSKVHSYCPVDGYVGHLHVRVTDATGEAVLPVEIRRKCVDCGADMGDVTALYEPDGPTNPADPGMLVNPRSPEKLALIRLRSQEGDFDYGITEFTCNGCLDAPKCLWAFDTYNTNGDCLASK